MTRNKRNNQPSQLSALRRRKEGGEEKSFQPQWRMDQGDPHGCKLGRLGDAAHIGKDFELLLYFVNPWF